MTTLINARADFPILSTSVYGRPLVYLDNGATTQKPQVVIDSLIDYYTQYNANVHRGVHYLSQVATDKMEAARSIIASHIHAARSEEIIFTKGTTDGINLLAFSLGMDIVKHGDAVLITEMEHHSNIVPWQMMCERNGAELRYIPLLDDGTLDISQIDTLLDGVKVMSITWVSNTLGTVNPVQELIKKARSRGIITVIDAAQALPHMPIDVQELGCNFLVASGHKAYGPTGIGFLYGTYALLEKMTPYQGGGSMIIDVSMAHSTYAAPPFRWEAGTPHIAGAIGMGVAIEYMNVIGMKVISEYEATLLKYLEEGLKSFPQVKIVGRSPQKAAVVSMIFDNAHPYDVGELLDKQGIAVRTGHHCCQPIMNRYGINSTLRVSLGLYNDKSDIDAFLAGLDKALSML